MTAETQRDFKSDVKGGFLTIKEFSLAEMAEEQQSGRLGRWEKQPEPGDTPQNRLKATHSNPVATTTA